MNPWPVDGAVDEVHTPRPGHADLPGCSGAGIPTCATCSSAPAPRSAARVAAGGLAKAFLAAVGVTVDSHGPSDRRRSRCRANLAPEDFAGVDDSPVRCLDPEAAAEWSTRSTGCERTTRRSGNVRGGRIGLVRARSHVAWDERLDARPHRRRSRSRRSRASLLGEAWEVAGRPGSELTTRSSGTRRAAGSGDQPRGRARGRMTNGEPLVVRAAMKPLSTLLSHCARSTPRRESPRRHCASEPTRPPSPPRRSSAKRWSLWCWRTPTATSWRRPRRRCSRRARGHAKADRMAAVRAKPAIVFIGFMGAGKSKTRPGRRRGEQEDARRRRGDRTG